MQPVSPGTRVLLIAPPYSYRIPAYLTAARRLGIELTIASRGRYSLVSEIARGLHIDLTDPDAAVRVLAREHAARPFHAVIGSDDAAVELSARLADAVGLASNPPDAVRCARRKDLARARLAAAGLPVPEHRRIDLARPLAAQIEGLVYPVVAKPLALSASRGVIRADDPAQLSAACARIERILRETEVLAPEERDHVLVERFIPGAEVAVEGILRGGALTVLAVFDKPDPLDGPYFEETYYITPSRLPQAHQARIAERVEQACRAYGLREGPVHAELRWHDDEAWIIEVAARTIGGECARLLRFGTGFGLEELVLLHAVGRPPEPQATAGAAGVLMIPTPRAGVLRRVEGVLAAQRVALIEDVQIHVREGYALTPLPEGASYLGFIFARGDRPEAVEAALRAAHAALRVVTAPLLPVAAASAG